MPDVVVVGGGVIGAACALELARAGMSVTLLERSELAAGASGRNHGLLFRPSDPALVQLYEDGLQTYRRLDAEGSFRFLHDREPIGILVVYDSEASRAGAEAEARHAEAVGVAIEDVGANDVRSLEPNLAGVVEGGYLLHDGMRVDPALLTLAMAIEARSLGADIRTGASVKGILRKGDRVSGVACDDGIVEAPVVVLAAGPWTPKLGIGTSLTIPVHGARGWIIHAGPSPNVVHRIVEYGGWHLPPGVVDPPPARVSDLAGATTRGDANFLIHPAPADSFLLGGSRISSVRDELESPEVVNELAQKAIRLLPVLANVAVIRTWSGVRPMSPDGRPLIGPTALEGLWVASGHGSQGVILAAGTGLRMAELIANAGAIDASLDPRRFSATS